MTKIKPMPDYLLIEQKKTENITNSGFVLSSDNKTSNVVVEIGASVKDIKIGDSVYYNSNSREIIINGKHYLILHKDEVIAKAI